jgi:hypothetical protein
MSTPRRYRIALRTYPAAYRRERGPELVATLADGDDNRGGPSTGEAFALALHGLALRAAAVGSPQGLLAVAAALVTLPLIGAFGWAEHTFVSESGTWAGFAVDAPGLWWQTALATVAFVALAIGPGKVLERPRRRLACTLLAAPVALLVFATPARIFDAGLPDAAAIAQSLGWLATAPVDYPQLTLPPILLAVLGTWFSLRLLGRMTPPRRQRVLACAFIALAGAVVVDAWQRPDIPVPYERSAFDDLEAGTFLVIAGLVLALASLLHRPSRARELDVA